MMKSLFLLALCVAIGLGTAPALAQDKGPDKKAGEKPKDPPKKDAGDDEGGGKPVKKDAAPCGRKPTAGDEPNTREHFRNFHDDGGDCHCACKHNPKKEGPVDPPPQKKVGPVEPPPQKKIGGPVDDAPKKKDAAPCGRKPSDGDDEKTREHFKNVHKDGECHCACKHNIKKEGPVEPPPQKKIGPPDGAPPPVKKIGGSDAGAPKKDGSPACGRKPSDADDAKTKNHFRNAHKGGECHCDCDHVKEGGK